jgi:hypothetical protein
MVEERLQIIIEAINKSKAELAQLQQDLGGVTQKEKKAEKATGGLASQLGGLQSAVLMGVGAVVAFGAAAKKAFDLSEEGASLLQLEMSFLATGISMEEMSAAARGTVAESDLMSAALTLLAGTSGQLEAELSQALPALLEIAKAANKVNPALGSTAFLFQSLATGVKRGSTLLIDNTGVTFTASAAYTAYAQVLNKTVDELTDTEKKLAILHMTVSEGQNLIVQAGGNTESYADEWAILTARIKDSKDGHLKFLSVALRPLIAGLNESAAACDACRESTEDARKVLGENAMQTIINTEENRRQEESLDGVRRAIIGEVEQIEIARQAQERITAAIALGTEQAGIYSDMMIHQVSPATEELTVDTDALTEAQSASTAASLLHAAALGELSEAAFVKQQIDALTAAVKAGTLSQEDAEAATRKLLTTTGQLSEAEDLAAQKTDNLRQQFIAGKIGPLEFAEAVLAVKSSLDAIPDSKTIHFYAQTHGSPPSWATEGGLTTPGGIYAQALGGDWLVNKPTLFLAGEAGPERATFTPLTPAGDTTTTTNSDQRNITINYYGVTRPPAVAEDLDLLNHLLN